MGRSGITTTNFTTTDRRQLSNSDLSSMLYNNNRFINLVNKDLLKFLVHVKYILREVRVKWILHVYTKFMWTELHLLKCMGIFITWNWGEGKLVVFSCRTCPKHKLIILDYNSKHTFLTIFIKINRALWKEIIFQCVYNWR